MIWRAKNVIKTESIWHKLDKETKYDLLNLSEKDRQEISLFRAKRIDKRAKAKEKASQ